MKLQILLLTTMLALATAACGPEKTADQKNKEQENANLEIDSAELAPLAGFYIGDLKKYAGGDPIRAGIYLVPITISTNLNGKLVKTASMQATFFLCRHGLKCDAGKDFFDNADFSGQTNTISFNSKTGAITLYTSSSSSTGGGGNQGGSGGGFVSAVQFTFNGYLNGDVLSGELSTSRPIGSIDAKRTTITGNRRK